MQEIADRLGRGRGNGEKTRLVKKLGQEADSLLTCPIISITARTAKTAAQPRSGVKV